MSNEKAVKNSQLTNAVKQMSDYLKGKIDDNTTQLDNVKDSITEHTTQLDNIDNKKLDKTGILTMANMGQDVKEAMTGGSVAVVGIEGVDSINIKNKAVGFDKIQNKALEMLDINFNSASNINMEHGEIAGSNGVYFDDENNTRARLIKYDWIYVKDYATLEIKNDKYSYNYYIYSPHNKEFLYSPDKWLTETTYITEKCYVSFEIKENSDEIIDLSSLVIKDIIDIKLYKKISTSELDANKVICSNNIEIPNTWVSGKAANDHGNMVIEADNARCLNTSLIDVPSESIIRLNDDNFKFTFHTVDLDNSSFQLGTTWYETDYEFNKNSFIKLQVAKKNNSIITIDECNNLLTIEHKENIANKINKIESKINNLNNNNNNMIDLVMFMGQSNMAGRGVASESPVVPHGYGYEFRAISDNTKLYDIIEPFGVNENNVSGINEPGTKTGSMVSSFIINYFKLTNIPIVAVSASKGGSSINEWQPNGAYLNDAISRFNSAKEYLLNNEYTIRHKFMVWCQGETDGDNAMSKEDYATKIKLMIDEMCKQGIEKCFIVRIGNYRDDETRYNNIIQAQTELCKEYDKAVLVSTKFDKMATDGLMKDVFHYKQEGYNITGTDAGINTAFYINNLKEPTMYDWENQNLYYSYKN